MKRILLVCLVLAACSKSKSSSGSLTCDAAKDSWKSSKLTITDFKKADDLNGAKCEAGTVAGMDTTLCSFPDAATASAAVKPGYARVGDVPTGQSLASGKCLVLVADRKNTDPSGKTVNQITAPFRKH